MSNGDARRRLLTLTCLLLSGAGCDNDRSNDPLTVTIRRGRVCVEHTATAEEVRLLLAAADLPEPQQNIVQAMHELGGLTRDLTVPEIARRAGYKVNSRFYTEFRALQTAGLVRPTPDGYRLDVSRAVEGPG